ncbi:unnamed protein product [Colias eurytheme]|nr:unnamed protein product [Colias eurytheme]
MRTKTLLVLCLQVLFYEKTCAQCYTYGPTRMERYGISRKNPYAVARSSYQDLTPSSGFSGQLLLENLSNLPPPSFSIVSDGLVINGAVSVSGTLPFVSSVAIQGDLPVCGMGTVDFNSASGIQEMPVASRRDLAFPYIMPYY